MFKILDRLLSVVGSLIQKRPTRSQIISVVINRSWRLSTTPNTTKFFLIIFKLIQQSIMVILSCLAKKNQNLNSRKKSSVYY